ncbi:MaoC family dehydratase [Pseudoalteromonas viridis]|uniref:MaoC family dehydratase n=1 Tax=Pseudoalteromonas viridis TaxID=339617 RepID=A0ABX7V2Z0_9GAMM|nr:MaoC family dehydratase [Pseudoalteromonas viridis]QTL35261.1 MaoC family dehydratase [Pseudoalteromonas viridis]
MEKQTKSIERATPGVGYEIKQTLNLSERQIIDGAMAIGDRNPIHTDAAHPNTQKFGGLVASGSFVTGVFSALLPSDFINYGPMLGSHMDVKFKAPIRADVDYFMSWVVDSLEYKKSLNGTVYNMVGTVLDGNDKVMVRANASIVLY